MNFSKRLIPFLLAAITLCAAVSAQLYAKGSAVSTTGATLSEKPVVILDAGHEALSNTIKNPEILFIYQCYSQIPPKKYRENSLYINVKAYCIGYAIGFFTANGSLPNVIHTSEFNCFGRTV